VNTGAADAAADASNCYGQNNACHNDECQKPTSYPDVNFEWTSSPTIGEHGTDNDKAVVEGSWDKCNVHNENTLLSGFRCVAGYTYATSSKNAYECLPVINDARATAPASTGETTGLSVEAAYQNEALKCQAPSGSGCEAPPPCDLNDYTGGDDLWAQAVVGEGDNQYTWARGSTVEGAAKDECFCNVGHYGTMEWVHGVYKLDASDCEWNGYWKGDCKPCSAGTYESNTGSTECVWCETGTYEDVTTSTECKWCEVGTYESLSYSTECSWCETGTYESLSYSTECSWCETERKRYVKGSRECAR
jgi:hypothetical protein